VSDAAPESPPPHGGTPKPAQALSPWMAVIWFFATPGLLLFCFLFAWQYPPLWAVDLVAFGPPLVGGALLAASRILGKPLRFAMGMTVPACLFGAIYTTMRLGEVSTLDWAILLPAALALGVVTAWRVARRVASRPIPANQKVLAVLGLGGLATAYIYAAAALVNVQGDLAPPQYFAAKVVAKSMGGGRHRDWYVTLGPWGTERETVRHSVWPEVYDALEAGEIACVDLHQGLLGLRWVDIAPCAPFERPQAHS
jgi:hypothetical protein